jgi:hypothetical protein
MTNSNKVRSRMARQKVLVINDNVSRYRWIKKVSSCTIRQSLPPSDSLSQGLPMRLITRSREYLLMQNSDSVVVE